MRTTVFESYAVLALLFDEPGKDAVMELLQQAALDDRAILITAVNWAEVLYRSQHEQGDAGVAAAKRFEATMPIEVVPVDLPLAELAAEYKATAKLGLADAFAAALAKHKRAVLVTGDPDFKSLRAQIKIEWLK